METTKQHYLITYQYMEQGMESWFPSHVITTLTPAFWLLSQQQSPDTAYILLGALPITSVEAAALDGQLKL